ncbi:MAG: DUF2207 domain-containing protein [Candidatus Micrarchaeota archaeon]
MRRYLLLLIFAVLVCAAFAKDFSMSSATADYTIHDDGSVHVVETINYNLYDCSDDPFSELYLQKPPSLELSNATGHCVGTTCKFRIDEPAASISHDRELILELTDKRCGDVTAVFEYDIKIIVKYQDGAQFYYKLWGDQWEKSTQFTVNIDFPGDVKDAKSYLHYGYYADKPPVMTQAGQQISIFVPNQPPKQLLEINVLMPLSWFTENGSFYYNDKLNQAGLVSLEEKTVKDLEAKRFRDNIMFYVFIAFIAAPFILIPALYLLFGTELSPAAVDYIWPYEHDPPSEHGPAECIFFLTMSKTYQPSDLAKAISATMMSLVNKGAFDVEEKKSDSDVIFTFRQPKEQLRDYEQSLYDYMKDKAVNGQLSMNSFKTSVAPSKGFYDFTQTWQKLITKNIDEKKYADMTGSNLFIGLVGLHTMGIFFGMFAGAALGFFDTYDFLPFCLFCMIFVDMILIGLFAVKKTILGRWTKEGRVLNLKWTNFKKYLSDFTALEEHPPASVKLWDHYMTYAVALGVADKTIQAMKKIAPTWVEQTRSSHIYAGGFAYMAFASSMTPTYSPHSSSSGGGFSGGGGFGGGGGGGGGGAR